MDKNKRISKVKWMIVLGIMVCFFMDDLYGNYLVKTEIDRQASLQLKNQAERIVSIYDAYEEGAVFYDAQQSETNKDQMLEHLNVINTMADVYYRQYLRNDLTKGDAQEIVSALVSKMLFNKSQEVKIIKHNEKNLDQLMNDEAIYFKDELNAIEVVNDAFNQSRTYGYGYYEIYSDEIRNKLIKRGVVVHFTPWNWDFVLAGGEVKDNAPMVNANLNLATVLDENIKLLSAMDNLFILSNEGYLSYHNQQFPKQMKITYVEKSNSFYKDVNAANTGELILIEYPDGLERLSYVLDDKYRKNKLIVALSVADIEFKKNELVKFNRIIEFINFVMMLILAWLFLNGMKERREE